MELERYNKENPLHVIELFAGYGSQRMALERLKQAFPPFDFTVDAISEIDRDALRAYKAVHGDCPNLGDVSKIDWQDYRDRGGRCDLLTYSFPCQDISNAGLQRGFSEGSATRSGLLWECEKAIAALKPRYQLMENVKALTQKKFLPEFQKWQDRLKGYGYSNFWKVLDATQFNVPQHRERVFMVSIRDFGGNFHWPRKMELVRCIEDIMEENVGEQYFLRASQVSKILAHIDKAKLKGNGFRENFNDAGDFPDEITPPI